MDTTLKGSRVNTTVAIVCALVVAAVALPFLPYLAEIKTHIDYASQITQRDLGCSAFYRLPLGYAAYLTPFMSSFGEQVGVKLANYVAFAAALMAGVWWLQRARADRSPAPNATWAAPIVFVVLMMAHPYSLLSLGRANESMLVGALVLISFSLMQYRTSFLVAALIGITLGLVIQVRTNAASLFLPVAFWAILPLPDIGRARRLFRSFALIVITVLAAAGTYVGVSYAATGCSVYLPTNGVYNLYAGTNSFAQESLLKWQNGEPSLAPALRSIGITIEPHDVAQSVYVDLSKRYVSENSLGEAQLLLVKLLVFFEPRLTNAHTPGKVAGQLIAWIPTMLVIIAAIYRSIRRKTWLDQLVLLMIGSYAAPFILTNSDPRLRFPIDVAVLPYLAYLLG